MLSDLPGLEVATSHRGFTTVQLIGSGLLLHELVYLSSKGGGHLVETTAPVLGLRVPAPLCVVLHLGIVLGSASLVLAPTAAGIVTSLVVLSLRIACFPVRLSNHLIVAWFFLLALSLDALIAHDRQDIVGVFGLGAIQIITTLTYGIAGLHKLSHDYLHPRMSCGPGLIVHYLLQRGVRLRKWPRIVEPIGIHAVLLSELLPPALLLVNGTRSLAITLAFFMHIAFGFLAHIHFSTMMFAGLSAFCPDELLAAILSISFVALLPDTTRRALTDRVRSLLDAEAAGGEIAIPYRTDVYWCTRRPG